MTSNLKTFRYYFDGQGKAVRPVIAMTVGRAFNVHCGVPDESDVPAKQRKVAIISEMIHTASLAHDDVLDRFVCFFLKDTYLTIS